MMAADVVHTDRGALQGRRDGRAFAWLGVPYAAAPVGPLRFRPPQPPEPWPGIRNAGTYGPACPQAVSVFAGGTAALGSRLDEDCLNLNVWSPAADGRRRPVMVWIHGGAFRSGSGALYRGAALAALGDCVIVTINYRLGVFGFANLGALLGEKGREGNLGLRDMMAALRWVQGNIAAFGGDPDCVTIAGESAGSIAVSLLMLCPDAQPLFHQAIMQSGTFSLAHSRARSEEIAGRYRRHLGLSDQSALARHSVASLLRAQEAVAREVEGTSPAAPWFDGQLLPGSHAAASAVPLRPIPLLIGSNRDEINLFEAMPGPKVLPTRRAALKRLVERDLPKPVAAAVLQAYPDTRGGERRLASDLVFTMPGMHFAERHAASAPTWAYRLDQSHPLLGACHGLELFYLWDFKGLGAACLRGGFLTGLRSGLSERMRASWTTFVRTGDPGETWPRYDPAERLTKIFALQDQVQADPMRAERTAWGGYDALVGH